MGYTPHHFAYLDGYDRSGIRYLWSDARASEDFAFPIAEADALADRLEAASLRSILALCTALFELTVARLEKLHGDPYPGRLLESAWISLADRCYAHYDEEARSEWLGPIRGPLWCGFTWLSQALHFSDDTPSKWQSAIIYLVRLAYHLIPAHQPLTTWLNGSIERMLQYHPAVVMDPLDDLFGHHAAWRRGPYITGACFDLTQPYDLAEEHGRMEQLLRHVQWSDNPLLKSPEELSDEGFVGEPYFDLPPYLSLRP